MNAFVLAAIQMVLATLAAPLVLVVAKRTKAFWQSRQGPRWSQSYDDLAKLWRKGLRVSEHASWLFLAAPALVLACFLTATTLVPLVTPASPLGFAGDLLLLVYLMAAGRFLLALAGLDPGSAFGGLGSSREVTFASLIEPGLVVALLSLSFLAGSTSLDAMAGALSGPISSLPPTLLLSLAALLVLTVAELDRVPVDNPATHLELTMVHEAMVLEQSGPNLALVDLANGVKHVILLGIVATVFLPWNVAVTSLALGVVWALVTLAKILLLMVVISTSESWMAKWRVFRIPELTTIAFLLAFFAFLGLALAAHGGA